jgi:hemoglobin
MNKYSDDQLTQLIFLATQEFYELVFKDPWLKEVFAVIDKQIITNQQTDFMVQSMGGPKKYGGRTPSDAHPHINIDEEMWIRREELLKIAFDKMNTPEDIREQWIKIDNAFKKAILKKSLSDCKKRYATDVIINIPKPN